MGQGQAEFESSVSSHEVTARRFLESDQLDRAIEVLESYEDPSGVRDALLGAAYFRQEKYGIAAECVQRAIAMGQSSSELQLLAMRARANAAADVRRAVPEPVVFTRDMCLRGPELRSAAAERLPPREPSGLRKALRLFGTLAGRKFGEALQVATRFANEPNQPGRIWTSWYQHDLLRATLMLARRRERLNRAQLYRAYPEGERVGLCPTARLAPSWAGSARAADGSWNDLREPQAGAANTRFGFNTDPMETAGESARLLHPNPRLVSRVLLTRDRGFKPVPFLNLSAASWIQFMTHDWVSYGDPAPANVAPPYRIPLDESDPARRLLCQTEMLVRRTQRDPTHRAHDPRDTHINEVTSWWDGSQLYGSDGATLAKLRTLRGGKLALDLRTGNLPVADDGVEQTGFRRNWWVGLSMLHTLFTREHNSICDMLAVRYPTWEDQRLFDVARLINAAVMAKLHTVEWTPAFLPNRALHAAMNANWYGFLTNLLRAREQRRTVATINIADPVAGGIVGNATNNHGVPYALTREFLSVYRLHSLLPDEVALYRTGADKPEETLPLAQLRQAASHNVSGRYSMADLFYSFGRQHPGQLVLNNFPDTLQNLSIPGAGFYDLAAVDVLRDRERGVPRYNHFRRLLGMLPIVRFEDLTSDPEAVARLKSVYPSVEDLDLLVGNLAEAHRPTGFGFGETLFEVFILNASRRLEADRFFTDDYNEQVYTPEGLEWVDRVTFKSVLLRNYPRLMATGLSNIDNGFEPWDLGKLEPERHPLRAFAPDLAEKDRNYVAG
jgi:hypothetical protein